MLTVFVYMYVLYICILRVCVYVYMCTCMYACMCMYIYIYAYACVRCRYTYMYSYIYIYIHKLEYTICMWFTGAEKVFVILMKLLCMSISCRLQIVWLRAILLEPSDAGAFCTIENIANDRNKWLSRQVQKAQVFTFKQWNQPAWWLTIFEPYWHSFGNWLPLQIPNELAISSLVSRVPCQSKRRISLILPESGQMSTKPPAFSLMWQYSKNAFRP